MIRERQYINKIQFERIIQWIMSKDEELTTQVLSEFLISKNREDRDKHIRKSSVHCWSAVAGSEYVTERYMFRY